MYRNIIVVGDEPVCGGTVLSYESFPVSTIDGHRVALVGGRVFCEGCKTIGFIAKAGGPYRPTICGAEQVLEGDVVVCKCPIAPPLVSKNQSRARCDDRGGVEGIFDVSVMGSNWYCPNPQALTSSKKIVDDFVKHPVDVVSGDTICPNMTDAKFCENMMKLRDRATRLIAKRLVELKAWDVTTQARVLEWFGRRDEDTRQHLLQGFPKCITALNNLTCANFVRYTPAFGIAVGCTPAAPSGQAAAVCKSDTKSHTIAFTPEFCVLRDISGGRDSQLSVLLHEISHFEDVFGTDDPYYFFSASKNAAMKDPDGVRKNADTYAGYIVWDSNFHD